MVMGKAIGVFGDPNTGKSVFSYLLFNEFKKRNLKVFRQEGDPASPTAPWFFETACIDPHRANELRKKIKTGWCEKSANWVRDSVRGLKKGFDYVLVDLGGGRPPIERVTPELKTIMQEIDEAIILCPKNSIECVEGWQKEIKEKAPHIKIIDICWSDILAESEVNEQCVFGSLERQLAVLPPAHLEIAVSKFVDKIIGKEK
jgi:hypothetical protein